MMFWAFDAVSMTPFVRTWKNRISRIRAMNMPYCRRFPPKICWIAFIVRFPCYLVTLVVVSFVTSFVWSVAVSVI